MAKIVNDTELIFEESDIKKDGGIKVIEIYMSREDYEKFVSVMDSITKIVLPDNVTKIDEGTFFGYSSLKSINIPDGVTEIGNGAFQDCYSLESIVIPDSVTKIENKAFGDCKSLKSVRIPDGVTEIGDWAFEDCQSLESVDIPDSVTKIGDGAFHHCHSLKSVHIPDSVTKIGLVAFADCTSIHYKGQDITSLIKKYDFKHFDVIKSLYDNDLPLTDDMFDKAMDAKRERRLRGFVVKTKKRLSEREMPEIENTDSDNLNFEL